MLFNHRVINCLKQCFQCLVNLEPTDDSPLIDYDEILFLEFVCFQSILEEVKKRVNTRGRKGEAYSKSCNLALQFCNPPV